MKKKILLLCMLSCVRLIFAQQETVELEEVTISDGNLLRFAETQTQSNLSDSILERNGSNLTTLLSFHSLIYFKENGAGMVSSPSFRGTSASHTAVIWNGININSAFLGQTDFSIINPMGFDQMVIKSGGGSVAYGSSAIGGSIHLNNELKFRKGFENQLITNYGSYNSYGINFQSTYSDEKLSLNLNFGRNGSDNDYEIPSSNRKNANGQFYHQHLGIESAYKINSKNSLKFYGNLSDSDRHFSLISPNALKTKYQDYTTKSMVEWQSQLGRFTSTLKAVYLGEEFRYFPSIQSESFEFGEANTYVAKYDLNYHWKKLMFNWNMDFSQSEVTSSQINFAKRQIASASVQMKHSLGAKFLYEASIRQEITDSYDSPFLYSFGLKWDVAPFYQLRLNTSKNFRMPTFNDLFWPGGGNQNLHPETSFQYEMGNEFRYKDWTLSLVGFHNSITNYIQWVPSGSLSVPENVGKVRIVGIESILGFHKKWKDHQVDLKGSYAYTLSENVVTDKQLIYVPFHKSTASAGYSWKRISTYYQWMYNGKVFTDAGNSDELDAYFLSNLGIELGLGKKNQYKLGFQVANLLNEEYQNVENRAMPGRNYRIAINIKF